MFKRFAFILVTASLAGCVTPNPQQEAAQAAMAARPTGCSGKTDCDVKWSRALDWVQNNSAYKTSVASDMLIQTMGPLPDSTSSAFTITKVANGDGSYTINFASGCDNMFGCLPNATELKASFVETVMAPRGN